VLQNTSFGGMSGLLDHLEEGGLGEAVEAWTTGGDHPAVSRDAIKEALGDQHVQQIATSLGISTDEVAQYLAEHLPAMAQAHAAQQEQDDSDWSSDPPKASTESSGAESEDEPQSAM